jgi:hypothetical protein
MYPSGQHDTKAAISKAEMLSIIYQSDKPLPAFKGFAPVKPKAPMATFQNCALPLRDLVPGLLNKGSETSTSNSSSPKDSSSVLGFHKACSEGLPEKCWGEPWGPFRPQFRGYYTPSAISSEDRDSAALKREGLKLQPMIRKPVKDWL